MEKNYWTAVREVYDTQPAVNTILNSFGVLLNLFAVLLSMNIAARRGKRKMTPLQLVLSKIFALNTVLAVIQIACVFTTTDLKYRILTVFYLGFSAQVQFLSTYIAVQRLIAITYPLKAVVILTRRSTYIHVATIYVFNFALIGSFAYVYFAHPHKSHHYFHLGLIVVVINIALYTCVGTILYHKYAQIKSTNPQQIQAIKLCAILAALTTISVLPICMNIAFLLNIHFLYYSYYIDTIINPIIYSVLEYKNARKVRRQKELSIEAQKESPEKCEIAVQNITRDTQCGIP